MTFQSHLGLYVDIVLGTYFTIAVGEYVLGWGKQLLRWRKLCQDRRKYELH